MEVVCFVLFCFFLTGIDTSLWAYMTSLHTKHLPKLPSAYLQSALCAVMVFHVSLLLINELTSQQNNCSSRPMLLQFTGLIIFPTTLKRIWNKILQEAVNALNQHPIYVLFLPQPGFTGQGIKGWEWKWHSSVYHKWPTSKTDASHYYNVMHSWPRGLSSKGRNASSRKHNNNSMNRKLRLSPSHFGHFVPLNQ